jgi:hypothetical protein
MSQYFDFQIEDGRISNSGDLESFPLIPSSMLPPPERRSKFLAAGLMISPRAHKHGRLI